MISPALGAQGQGQFSAEINSPVTVALQWCSVEPRRLGVKRMTRMGLRYTVILGLDSLQGQKI